ncbi:hypothetical protein Pcinc_018486 [Petrolisthes cinctipes]|uniref:Sulfotransferase domain-containing protein n=1 Tax=Petrolisthes cinctipes TaxID=88211 RepID=A0AAE1FM32_PETCI|nr:hypothetical protein Pcinc_018486 [Petrolisthes cinctipes]
MASMQVVVEVVIKEGVWYDTYTDIHTGITSIMSKDFPYTIETLPEEENTRIKRDFEGYLSGCVRVPPKGYFYQAIYRDFAASYYNLKLYPTDVFVASYPKCGTTWTQELVWMVMNDFDEEGAKVPLDKRFPMIESDHVLDPQVFQDPELSSKMKGMVPKPGDYLALVSSLSHPRPLKTHMPFSLLPPSLLDTCKVVYVARDPKDVVVSYYHHHRMWITHGYKGDFNTFLEYFMNDQLMFSPFWEHIREAWDLRHHPNLLILTYHDLQTNLAQTINKVASFLGKSVSEEQMVKLQEHLHIDSMKKNPATNAEYLGDLGVLDKREGGFIRKGGSGGWRKYFDDKMVEKFEKWMVEKGKGLEKEFKWLS